MVAFPPLPDRAEVPGRRGRPTRGAVARLRVGMTAMASVVVVLLATVAFVPTTPASAATQAGTRSSIATEVIDGCTVVLTPTRMHFTDCPNMNLGTANFSGLNLRFADFSGSTFVPGCEGVFGTTTNCSGADFDHADLSHAQLKDAVFGACCGSVLGGVTVSAASFSGTDLERVDASGATFIELTNVDLRGADLAGATVFGGVDGADLTHADLTGASVAYLFGGFTNSVIRGTNFTGTDLSGRSFNGAHLSEQTDFQGTEIAYANFTGTKLVPPDRTVHASSSSGAVVHWQAGRTLPGASLGSCAPTSGSQFPIGVTTVQCAVKGGPGLPNYSGPNAGTASFTVTVQ